MEFQLIDKEITEARLFRKSASFKLLHGKDIANLLYLNTVILYLLSQTDEKAEYAQNYAKSTIKYGTYSLFRTHAPDLYMLAYQVAYPNNDHARLENPHESKQFLHSLPFDKRRHLNFIRKISTGQDVQAEAASYLYRLEFQLSVKDSRYKTWRRSLSSWSRMNDETKHKFLSTLIREMYRIGKGSGRGSELLDGVKELQMKYKKKYTPPKVVPDEKPSGLQRAVSTAIGAVAGGYAGKKLSGMEPTKARNVGAGIGAIAGYWASGRRQK